MRKPRRLLRIDVTALVRCLVQDEKIREDQRWAWERWRNNDEFLKKP